MNLPNKLTLTRILLVPVFMVFVSLTQFGAEDFHAGYYLIAGFPSETEEQFEDLCNFVKEVRFDRLGCFAYSAEENTVAAKMDGQIDQETKDRRAELVMQIQTGIMAQKQAEKVGQTVRVLCDGIDEESGLYLCRTTGDAPEVDGNVCVSSEEPLYPGQFYDVLVEDSDLYDLYGTVAK